MPSKKPSAKTSTPEVLAAPPVAKKVASKAVRAPAKTPKPTTTTPAPAVKAVKVVKAKPQVVAEAPKKAPKEKLVRDSFTMPRSDFALIDQLKDRALGFKRPTKKSELLRAGLQVLAGLSDVKLKAALAALAPLKAGRPKGTDQPA